ncbi:hypothetical protein [Adlercreutzia sp.]|uniref:hypothetical protein n=1 Tax=Adlercreutzia sp. TaxID=1872387 RepID=UPI003A86FE4E
MAQSVAAALPLVTAASGTDTAPSASAAPDSSASAASLADTESDVSPLSDTPPAPTAAGLVSLNAPNASTAAHIPDANGWVTCGTLRVKGGTYGTDFIYYPDVFQYPKEDGTVVNYGFVGYNGVKKSDLILVLSEKPLSFKNAEGTNITDGRASDAAMTSISIAPGNHADLTLAGVNINTTPNSNGSSSIPINVMTNVYDAVSSTWAKSSEEVRNRTSLHLTLADGTANYLATNEINMPAIRCGEGSDLIIDDAERNVDTAGNPVVPIGAVINRDTTLASGKALKAGDPHTALDSANPGSLEVWGGQQAAAIGGANEEDGGTMTFNGGAITSHAWTGSHWVETGAAIGGGTWGRGTDGALTFNSGTINAIGNYHTSGIGSGSGAKSDFRYDYAIAPDHIPCDSRQSGNIVFDGSWYYGTDNVRAGNITINGGFVKSTGFEHSSGFGNSCASTPNTGGVIRITGGTLYPSVTSSEGFPDFNADGGHVIITGGSVYTNGSFKGIGGTAWGNNAALADGYNPNDPDDPNKVFMVTIDLSADMAAAGEAGDNLIESWNLKVGGEDYPYGAPTQLIGGKLYLWLPKSATEQTVSVDLSYRGKDGQAHPFDTLFRNPGQVDQLKRYEDFELPKEYLNSLVKPYDGLPFKTYEITPEHPLRTPEVLSYDKDGNPSEYRWLTNTDDVTYRYRLYDKRDGAPVGDEVDSGKDMPVNVGVMKFTMVSREYSGSSDPVLADFANGYWGHRATGWCEITSIPSQVHDVRAVWADEGDAALQPGGNEHPSDQRITVSAVIGRGDTVDGKPLAADRSNATAPTCKAPRGRVQLFVDGEPVGDPVELLFDTKLDQNGNVLRDDSGNPVPDNAGVANATVVPNGEGGAETRFTYTFTPSDADWLVPGVGEAGKHQVSLQFLQPSDEQQEAGVPANYLESADPAKDPSAPSAEVVIEPIGPNPTVTPAPDPDCKDPDFPAPSVETGPGEPDDPAADPSEPGDKTYHGSITTTWGEPSKDNPHPGRVTLSIKTPSTGKISVTDASGNVFTADFLKDADGRPVRGEDGTYTLVLDPTAVGSGKLTIRQEANGAYTGSTWVYDVTVNPDVTVAPAPSLSKKAENLTHPDGPTQPGDRIRYTITAANGTAGSLWTGVVVRDPLPACLELDEGSVRLDNPRGGVAGKALTKAPLVAASDVGKFALAAADANGRRVLTVPAGNVPGGAEATITFECTVAADAAGEGAPAADLTNIAEATGTRPDPADPDKPMPDPANPGKPLPIDPDPTDPVTPPGPGRVVPANPEIGLTKTVENLTAPGANVTRIGDRLLYTVTLANTGAANSCLVNAVISDPLPVGIEPAAGTLRLAAGGGASVPVPDGAYDHETRTIAVTCGDIWGGGSAVLTFEVVVEAAALGQSSTNIAHAHGSIPSEDPDTVPSNPDPGKPTDPPADEPLASSDPVEPPTIIPDDPGRDDLSIAKTAENASRDDGTTHVGDTVRYRIALANSGPATGWMDAVIRDDVPHGLEPIAGTIRLALPDGREVAVDDGAYDPATRILAVAVGHLYGGQEAALSFDALVTKDALDTDIGNVGTAFGTPPSQWDPDRPAPAPGDPFRPEEGWDGYARGHESVSTDPVYPPGVTARGGVLQDADDSSTAREKQRATIAHKLAQTGDALSLALLLSAALALAAGALALAGRRRARRAR